MEIPYYDRARQQRPGQRRMARQSGPLGASDGATTAPQEQPERNFAPARRVTVPAGGEASVTVREGSGRAFGIDRMTFGGEFDGVLVTASTRNGKERLFNPVYAPALRQLFLFERLRGLLRVAEGNELLLSFENTTGSESTLNVQLEGYAGGDAIARQEECIMAAEGIDSAPSPELVVARGTVPAGATDYEIDIPARDVLITFNRFFVGTGANAADLSVGLRLGADTVREQVFVQQLHDAFNNMGASRPYQVEPRTQLKLAVSNYGGTDADVTGLLESYRR
jgi:hypothetical protein